jgi:5-methyltetrahydrofolate--homocysteine methyltransferase
VNADAIGLSALLVSTSKQMPICVQELDKRGLAIPVLIGGAAINRRFGRRTLFVEGERPYTSGVFYCKDAFEGLDTVEALMAPPGRDELVRKLIDEARRDVFLHASLGKESLGGTSDTQRSAVSANHDVPQPPAWGIRVLRDIPLGEVLDLLDLDELFRLQWGGRGSGESYENSVRDVFRPTLDRLRDDALRNGWLRPQAVYGYFPVQSDGNSVVVYDPAAVASDGGSRREIGRFTFPRQEGRDRLCLADYFRSVDSGEIDVLPLQVVTVGDDASRRFDELQALGEYSEAYFVHGIAVEAAEAVAEWLHRRIRSELGLPVGRGKRYSWGYGACPDLDDHALVFRLLPATEALGMALTTAFQLIPEQSTAAMIVHHPEAKYYSIRGEGTAEARSQKPESTANTAGSPVTSRESLPSS